MTDKSKKHSDKSTSKSTKASESAQSETESKKTAAKKASEKTGAKDSAPDKSATNQETNQKTNQDKTKASTSADLKTNTIDVKAEAQKNTNHKSAAASASQKQATKSSEPVTDGIAKSKEVLSKASDTAGADSKKSGDMNAGKDAANAGKDVKKDAPSGTREKATDKASSGDQKTGSSDANVSSNENVSPQISSSGGMISYMVASFIGGLIALALYLALQITDVASEFPSIAAMFQNNDAKVIEVTQRVDGLEVVVNETRALADQNNVDLGKFQGSQGSADLTEIKADIEARFAALDERLISAAGAGSAQDGTDFSGISDQIAALKKAVSDKDAQIASLEDQVTKLRDVIESGGAGEAAGLSVISESITELRGDIDTLKSSADATAEENASAGENVSDTGSSEDAAALEGLNERLTQLEEATSGQDNQSTAVSAEELVIVQTELANALASQKSMTDRLDAVMAELASVKEQASGQDDDAQKNANKDFVNAITLGSLKAALVNGDAFKEELAALENLEMDPEIVNSLKEIAATGLMSDADLLRSFSPVAKKIIDTSSHQSDNGGDVTQRLENRLKSILGMRPIGMAEGEDIGAILARVEVFLEEGQIEKAHSEIQKLPEDVRQSADEWVGALTSKVEAAKIIENLNSTLFSRLQDHY